MNTLINTAVFLFLVGATAYVGPAIDQATNARRTAEKQIADQQRIERRDRAAKEICGENAAWEFKESVLTCFTHRGYHTRKVSL